MMNGLLIFFLAFIYGCALDPSWRVTQQSPKQTQNPFLASRPEGLSGATDHYGILRVQDGEWEAESQVRPWSFSWLPTRDTYLFESQPPGNSPLEKYDRYVRKAHHDQVHAADYERKNLFDPNAAPWEGLCNAWSVASLMMPEPRTSVTIEGIVFKVGDLKALLVKSFEKVADLRFFGQRFNGDRFGVFDDLYPDQFHRVVVSELVEKRRPFIFDKDPGVAVWNTPAWKAHGRLVRDPNFPQVLHATTWIVGASPFVDDEDHVGTLSVVFEYTYDLWGDWTSQGWFEVRGGSWTGQSLDDHPDFVTVLPEDSQHLSANPEIKWQYVQEILKKGEAFHGLEASSMIQEP